ncbi:hypothetical protein [Roseomonas sp. BN140053]|uniref:hypothetical protein n=1 Tax=Roseomonas sp. BN140053 TaxID=3391898 RepID=UPI0039EB4ED8
MAGADLLPGLVPLLVGGLLLCSLALLRVARGGTAIATLAAQGVLLAAVAGWRGGGQGSAELLATAGVLLLGAGLLWGARGLLAGWPAPPERGGAPVAGPVAGVATVAVAALLLLPATRGSPAAFPVREELSVALAMLLLGMLVTILRRGAAMQVAGLLSLGHGLVLAALAVPGLPLPVALAVVLPGSALLVALRGGLLRHLRDGAPDPPGSTPH